MKKEEAIIHIAVKDRLRSWEKRIERALENCGDFEDHLVVSALREMLEDLKWIYHPANGEQRTVRSGNKLQAMGVVPGILDLCVVAPVGGWAGARAEIKKSAKDRASSEQVEFIDYCSRRNIKTFISHKPDALEAFIMDYLCRGAIYMEKTKDAKSPTTLTLHGCRLLISKDFLAMALHEKGIYQMRKGDDILMALNKGVEL